MGLKQSNLWGRAPIHCFLHPQSHLSEETTEDNSSCDISTLTQNLPGLENQVNLESLPHVSDHYKAIRFAAYNLEQQFLHIFSLCMATEQTIS